MSRTIYLDAPNIGGLEKRHLAAAIESGYVSTAGPFVPKFEDRMALYLGVPKAVSTQSGTAAIHMALHELGIGKGDEVIVPALTFVAAVNPVNYVGATPVFADVDPVTWNIDPADIKKRITKKTKAILPVHLYGNPCNMDAIMRIAIQNKLYVIEDATESLGARYRGRYTGTFGDFGCFSFNGNKVITTGGGGMVVGRDPKKLAHIKFLVNQARGEEEDYYHPEIGFNYRMTNIEAALGLAQMKKVRRFLDIKRGFNSIYREELSTVDGISFQEEHRHSGSSWWFSCITVGKNTEVARLQAALKKNKVTTRRIFMPVVEFSPYKKYKRSSYQNSYVIYEKGLCLPSSTLNSSDDIYYVCRALKRLI